MKWISVEDSLPNGGGLLLAYRSNNKIEIMFFSGHYKNFSFHTGDIRDMGKEPEDGNIVTHWMPLPEPPRTE